MIDNEHKRFDSSSVSNSGYDAAWLQGRIDQLQGQLDDLEGRGQFVNRPVQMDSNIPDLSHFQIRWESPTTVTVSGGSWFRTVAGTTYQTTLTGASESSADTVIVTPTGAVTRYVILTLSVNATTGVPTGLVASAASATLPSPLTQNHRVLGKVVFVAGAIDSIEQYWSGGDIPSDVDVSYMLDNLSINLTSSNKVQIYGWATQAGAGPFSDSDEIVTRHGTAGSDLQYFSGTTLWAWIQSHGALTSMSYIDLDDTTDGSYAGKWGYVPVVDGGTPPNGIQLTLKNPATEAALFPFWVLGATGTGSGTPAALQAYGEVIGRTGTVTDWAIDLENSRLMTDSTHTTLDWLLRTLTLTWASVDTTDATSANNATPASFGTPGGISVGKALWAVNLYADTKIELKTAGVNNLWQAAAFQAYSSDNFILGFSGGGTFAVITGTQATDGLEIALPGTGVFVWNVPSFQPAAGLTGKTLASYLQHGVLINSGFAMVDYEDLKAGDKVLCVPA